MYQNTYMQISNGTSNDTSDTQEKQKLRGEPVKYSVQAQQWVSTTALIAKPVLGDEQAKDNYDNKTIKIWRGLLDRDSDGDLIFTRAELESSLYSQ